ncbi:hypothetical protein A359_07170 [secondary endosymbiont of Ctenarytaina eucalypti]|uniref:Uncharacterized protein n=1 Tax=secondary endosymbiont of Ctenarytaina eucalypti TaxID=1199245 RepID=J3VT03_9ENTR|nr:hypothetical protein A359_07170 [secondary endosymbiont of Ctenarytaina eucalypti]
MIECYRFSDRDDNALHKVASPLVVCFLESLPFTLPMPLFYWMFINPKATPGCCQYAKKLAIFRRLEVIT